MQSHLCPWLCHPFLSTPVSKSPMVFLEAPRIRGKKSWEHHSHYCSFIKEREGAGLTLRGTNPNCPSLPEQEASFACFCRGHRSLVPLGSGSNTGGSSLVYFLFLLCIPSPVKICGHCNPYLPPSPTPPSPVACLLTYTTVMISSSPLSLSSATLSDLPSKNLAFQNLHCFPTLQIPSCSPSSALNILNFFCLQLLHFFYPRLLPEEMGYLSQHLSHAF